MPGIPFPKRALLALLIPLATLLPAAGAGAQTIRNTATLTFAGPVGDIAVPSNTVELTRGRYKTAITFHRPPAGWNPDYGKAMCEPLPQPAYRPLALDETLFAATAPLKSLDIGSPYVLALDAPGENHDPAVREKTWVMIDSGVRELRLELTETGANSGVFAGMVPAGGHATGAPETGCDIGQDGADWIAARFDGDDDNDGSDARIPVDPGGLVFDSVTGKPIDGATVTLIDDATGLPAEVLGDDGISSYPGTMVSGAPVTDGGGWLYPMAPGHYRFPLVRPGRYRLQVTPPDGYTGPSKAGVEDLKTLAGPHSERRIVVPGSFGGVFALVTINPVIIDIPLDPVLKITKAVQARLVLTKVASVREASAGDFVQYQLELRNAGDGSAVPAIVTDILPHGLRYRLGSTRGTDEPKVSGDGGTLTFTIADLAAGAKKKFTYLVEVAPGAPAGEAVNRASAATPGGISSAVASASVRIRALLFTDTFTVIGRVTEGDCLNPERGRKGIAGIRLLMEDGSYVVTDKDGLYHFEGVAPGTHVVQMDLASVPPTHAPVVCDADTRAARSPISRFVEGSGGSLQRVDFQLRLTGVAAAAASALPIKPLADAEAAGSRDDWLAQAEPGIGWMFPAIDHNPRAPAVRVVIRHAPSQRVALLLNGKPVDPLSFDGTDSDQGRGIAVSRWTGLSLSEGDNRLEARVLNEDGSVAATIDRIVHYANTPARAVYAPEQSRLVADGLTQPLLAVRVTDRDGRPVRAGTIVPFRVEQPYQAAQEAAAEQGRQLAGLERTRATARVVGDDGLAFIALQPTSQSGAVRIAVTLADRERETVSDIKAWLAAPAQDWVVVGFGKGSIGYDVLSGAEKPARGKSGEMISDGQLALYAKGRIKGSWLLTLAYDSDKDERRMRERGAHGTIDPDRYYTVYGDGTRQGYDAASRRKLYIRLERPEFQALFGDFDTGLVDTRLTRYSRTLNGARAEYRGNRVQVAGFAARDDSRYGRDEIQGNGLSGPYRLSGRDIVPNSDKLRLETRDRLRPDRVLDSQQLTRHIDYDIDPRTGLVRFREPILSRDAELNPVFIVADYETYGDGDKLVAGGRASLTLGKVEAGASVIHDAGVANAATVAGVDLRIRASRTTEFRAEAAGGGRTGVRDGRAWLAEVEHHGPVADLLVYARQQDRAFGLGQQNFGDAGSRRIGMDGRVRLSERWNLAGSAWVQDDLDDSARRVAGEARLEYRRNTGTVFAGVQFASDRTATGEHRDSRLLTLGGTRNLLDHHLELTAEGQIPLGGKDDSIDMPARKRLGAAWRFNPWLKLIGGVEFARGDKFTARTARLGFDVAPWSGARALATINQGAIGENGIRTFAQYGLSQSLPLGKRWTIDVTVDSSTTLSGALPTGDTINKFHPVAAGGILGTSGIDEDFTAATLGATYRGTLWSWNGRAEYRAGSREERWGLTSNLLRTLGDGSTLASGIRAYRLRQNSGKAVRSIDADIALALRRMDSRWSLLERFQLRSEGADGSIAPDNALAVPVLASDTRTTFRLINNAAINYRTGSEGAGHGFEASLYYGAKYVRGRYAGERFDGFVDVVGLEVRKDLTARFDIGANASVQHSWTNGAANLSLGASIGISPARNLWLTAGYNIAGYRDRDFEEARWTRKGPFLMLRFKFDQQSLGEVARPIFGVRE
ncbi:MAG: DUF11 domain-containing protein [Sphingomonas sp.]|uniref:hypothetical protein n=1 Tax=Sphingomonas sp. TaxID=28214 RepID=UPI0025E4112A|nr:hypothetical protein [Sphingomonas sp.]MBX3563613.1 DUF11 domain-containing protein [Sphingomonas sp.]